MSQGAIVNPNRAIPRFRLNNVTPFTYRDGLTYLQELESIKDKLVEVIDSHNEWGDAVAELVTELDEYIVTLREDIDTHAIEAMDAIGQSAGTHMEAIGQSAGTHITAMSDILSVAENVLSSVETISGLTGEDGAVSHLVDDPASLTRSSVANLISQMVATFDGALLAIDGMSRVNNRLTNPMLLTEEGWAGGNGTMTVADGVAHIVGTGGTSSFGIRGTGDNILSFTEGDVIWVRVRTRVVQSGATGLSINLFNGATNAVRLNTDIVTNPVAGEWVEFVETWTVPESLSGVNLNLRALSYWGSPANAAGKLMQVGNLALVNLSEEYGRGREPGLSDFTEWVAKAGNVVGESIWVHNKPQVTIERPEFESALSEVDGMLMVENTVSNPLFERGLSGWVGGNGALSVASGVASVVGSGNTSSFGLACDVGNVFTASESDVVWFASTVRVRGSGATALGLHILSEHGNIRVNDELVTDPSSGEWFTVTGAHTISSAWSGVDIDFRVLGWWGTPGNAAGKHVDVSSVGVVNLTKVFGRGHEPSRAEMDEWFTRRGGAVERGWFYRAPVASSIAPVESAYTKHRSGLNGVIMRFDDGFENVRTLAAPYMASLGMVGYVAALPGIPGHEYGTGKLMNLNDLQELHGLGWEIGNHTASNTVISQPGFLDDVDECSRILVNAGMPYPTTFTYPTGARNSEMDREMFMRFDQAQLTTGTNTSAIRFDRPVFHSGWTVIAGGPGDRKRKQLERTKRYISTSIAKGLTPVVAWHQIMPPGETATVEWAIEWEYFQELCDWIAGNGYPTINPRDLKPYNLVEDAGFNEHEVVTFSESAHPWGLSSVGHWKRDTEKQYTGLACIAVESQSAVTGSVSQGLALEPGTYRVSVVAKVDASAGSFNVVARPRRMFGDSVGPDIDLISSADTGGEFTVLTAALTVPDGAEVTSLFLRVDNFVGSAVVDNVSVVDSKLHDFLGA